MASFSAIFDRPARGTPRATSYDEWKAWALAEDERTGASLWKSEEACDLYDHHVIRRRYDEIVDIRRSGDSARLLFYLNEGLHGNMGGMGSPALYARTRFGTKELITGYIQELVDALHDLEAVDEQVLDVREKLAMLRRAQQCFGRSALMLSGAGSLGAFHLGVAKALSERDLLPNVVSGASAGSLVAAIVGTHPKSELPALFSSDGVSRIFALLRGRTRGKRRASARKQLRIENLRAMVEAVIPDMTFAEAFQATGRQISVSVAPAKMHQRSRLLNALTSPNALIREAVLASCAVPGLFPAVTLAARNAAGERCPYIPSRQWVDGSITDDLPARRLARLYGVNHFISSQANPVVLWAARDPHTPIGFASRLAGIYLSASQDVLRAIYPFTMGFVRKVQPFGTYTRLCFSVLTQDYNADVNIVPSRRLFSPGMLFSALSDDEAHALVADGERATWPRIEIIENCTKVSRCIEEMLVRIEDRQSEADAASA